MPLHVDLRTSAGAQHQPCASAPRRLPRGRCVSRKTAFLAAYRETGSLRAAAERAGIEQAQHQQWLKLAPAYRQAFTDAQLEVTDSLRDLVMERAMNGWLKPVYFRGRQCAVIRQYSAWLEIFLLKALMPEKYR